MRTLFGQYARVAAALLAFALLVLALPTAARAAGPTVTVAGSGTGTCNGRPVAALVQGETFDVGLNNFPIPAGAGVAITLTLPDGSIRGPGAMGALPLSMPPTVPRTPGFYTGATVPHYVAGPLINASLIYASFGSWPTGCYTITAVQQAAPGSPPIAAPFLEARAQFALLPQPFSAQAGNLKLSVQALGTTQPTGQQAPGLLVNIFGQGVPATGALAISIVQPDGAIAGPFPAPAGTVAADGTFNLLYPFTLLNPVGRYTFYATVTIPNPPNPPINYTSRAQFNLSAASATPTGTASLELLDRFSTLIARGAPISVVGRGFGPAPAPALRLVLPHGVQLLATDIPLPAPVAGPPGSFAIPAFTLGEGFPAGSYTLVAEQLASVGPPAVPARTATLTWRLIP